MPRYIIERDIPAVGSLSRGELADASARSCKAIREAGPGVVWLQSFVTADRTYCVYEAPDESAIRRHAEISGFPASRILEITGVIDPFWGNGPRA